MKWTMINDDAIKYIPNLNILTLNLDILAPNLDILT